MPAEFTGSSMTDYVYQAQNRNEDYQRCVQLLQKKHDGVSGSVNHKAPQVVEAVHKDSKKHGIPVNGWRVSTEEYVSKKKRGFL